MIKISKSVNCKPYTYVDSRFGNKTATLKYMYRYITVQLLEIVAE